MPEFLAIGTIVFVSMTPPCLVTVSASTSADFRVYSLRELPMTSKPQGASGTEGGQEFKCRLSSTGICVPSAL